MNRFIVGTGRCGSTLLSTMLACHPEVTSVCEFFNGLDGARRFQREPMSGRAYRALVCEPQAFLNMVLERGYPVPEIVYPIDDPTSRFGRGGDLPWILGSTLPRLEDAADALYDETCRFLDAQPDRSAPGHALALFAWWAERRGRPHWIERSGAAIDYLGALERHFGEARFVHIHRQGEEAALSMRGHHAFRLAIMLANGLPPGTGRTAAELRAAAPDADRITQLLESRPPPELFGKWWNDQVARGVEARASLPADRYREVRFEELLERPEETLACVARALALPDPEGRWREEAARQVRSAPAPRLDGLEAAERDALIAACTAGNAALGRAPLRSR